MAFNLVRHKIYSFWELSAKLSLLPPKLPQSPYAGPGESHQAVGIWAVKKAPFILVSTNISM